LSLALSARPPRLIQSRDDDDPEVTGRPPGDDDEPRGLDGDTSGYVPTGGQGGDEGTTGASAGVTEEPTLDTDDPFPSSGYNDC